MGGGTSDSIAAMTASGSPKQSAVVGSGCCNNATDRAGGCGLTTEMSCSLFWRLETHYQCTRLVSGGSSSWPTGSSLLAVSSHGLPSVQGESVLALVCLPLTRTPVLSEEDPTLMTSSNPN